MSCIKTDIIARSFNNGALDSSGGDPFHDPADLRREIVVNLIKQELVDGYFGQGSNNHGAYAVSTWMENASIERETFGKLVQRQREIELKRIAPSANAEVKSNSIEDEVDISAEIDVWSPLPPESICRDGGIDATTAQRFADHVRFQAAVGRAIAAVEPVLVERLVSPAEVEASAGQAFHDVAAYMRGRKWQRHLPQPTTSLVVKGGAATGIYSAGVVWVALNLINNCMRDDECRRPGFLKCQEHADVQDRSKCLAQACLGDHDCITHGLDYRIKLISGTSTGAMISTAVDYFNTGGIAEDRQKKIDKLAQWFTCNSLNELFCVRNKPLLDLGFSQTGVIEFDGIERLLSEAVSCDLLRNTSELLLNTVDFRSGRLYSLSDQDPSELTRPTDVIRGAVASAALPLIVKPVSFLPPNYSRNQPGIYLDGGIRSELPVMPVVRRGAERALVVSSDPSKLGETKKLTNAVDIATRYIGVATGAIFEQDLPLARTFVQSTRLAEFNLCLNQLVKHPALCPKESCNREAVCTADWASVCQPAAQDGKKSLMHVQSEGRSPAESPAAWPESSVGTLWRMATFFRDEAAVEPLHGYDFNPVELRRLFKAGADAARLRCLEIADMLGMPATDPHMRKKFVRWCTPNLQPTEMLCTSTQKRVAAGDFVDCPDRAPEQPSSEPPCSSQ